MKHLKMLLFSSLICFLISGSANAQLCGGAETQAQAKAADILDLGEIIAGYCVEVDMAEDKAEEEFAEAALDLADCLGEYIGCLDGGGPPEPLECIERVARCNKRALRDKAQACNEFYNDFKLDTRDTLITADRQDVDAEFIAWFYSDESDDCLASARLISLECTGL
jgi:hypothetical protein